MGKKGGSKTEITRYYASEFLGVCIEADALVKITIKEKEAWTGEETDASVFVIDKDQLFGGQSKEGGVQAVVYWLPGASDQVLPDELAQRMGRADGADCPGYRGTASVFFTGPAGSPYESYWSDHSKGKKGAYWSVNSPYLPGIWITVRRAPKGLNPDYALIQSGTATPTVSGTVELTWWQNSWYNAITQPQKDEARMGISFLDANGALIGSTTWSDYAAPIPWAERTLSADCPAGTVTIRLHQARQKHWGVNNDGYIDDISATLDGSPLTIINPGAELNHTGWTTTAGGLLTAAGVNGPHSGSQCFFGTGSYNEVYQDIVPAASPGADANPAHIIYECLTNTDWGMGSPSTAIDVEAFEAAGVALFAEGFGLSMLWTQQASIQDFIQEVLDHIQAVIFVDPQSGLLTIKLVRADYDESTLPELTPSNSDLLSFGRTLWGEISNEIVVTWTNPETEEEETVTAQDNASIAAQGGIISDSRNYYGVRNANLARRLAARDLRASGAPLATCQAEVDRTFWALRPASVVKVTSPEHGLSGLVMRVMNIKYGAKRIILDLLEDVFGLDSGDYVSPPGSAWVDPSEAPAALTIERVFTLPLFFAANTPDAPESPVYPEVLAGVLGTTTQTDAYEIDLWDEVTLSNGSTEWQQIGALNVIGHGLLAGALAAQATSTGVGFASLIGDTSPTLASFVLIGDGGEDEIEIAQVDAVGASYTLRRGVLDTVPRAWPADTPVWFLDDATVYEDSTVRAAGETADYKLLTRTSQGVLPLASAVLVSHTLTERPWLPNRPANVQVDGVLFNTYETPVDMTGRPDPWVTISWANRNRLTEDSQVLGWTDATVAPETGQTTGIEVLAGDGTTVLDTITGLSGTSYNVPDASFGSEPIVLIRPFAERSDADGDFVSLQAHGIWVQVTLIELVAEDGSGVITEGGDRVIFEG